MNKMMTEQTDPNTAGQGSEAEEELSVEEAFTQLEALIGRMEEEGISLEESFACYEKGVKLIKYCNDRIDRVEKKVQILRGENTGGDLE